MTNRLTVVIVSDFEASNIKSWTDERIMLKALSKQDISEPFSVIIVENEKWSHTVPVDLNDLFPDVKFQFVDESRSSMMLNSVITGIQSCYIAILEADAVPSTNWLREMVSILDSKKDIVAVSGKTIYGLDTMTKRVFSLLHRAYEDIGSTGETKNISNNGAVYHRDILIRYPYPYDITPFASARQRIDIMRNDGLRFYFNDKVTMIHAFAGISFILDFHRNAGYAAMSVSSGSLPAKVLVVIFKSYRNKLDVFINKSSRYLVWYDYPAALLLALFLPLLEIPGMLDFIMKKEEIPNTVYR